MRIILVGAGGDIGKAVARELGARHDLIAVGRRSGQMSVDMSDPDAVAAMYTQIGQVDAVICTAGDVHFAPLCEQTHQSLSQSLHQKVMGQINLVLCGLEHVSRSGSFTLTSGVLDRDPIIGGIGAATANGALGGFVASAAIDMPRGLRINVVSPGMLDVSAPRYGSLFAGHDPVPSERVGRAYAKSVEGALTGQVMIVQ